MKFLIVILALAAVAAAQQAKQDIVIVRQASNVQPDQYQYAYETSNGIFAEEQGQLKDANNEEGKSIVAQGQYAYTDEQGNKFEVKYVADENGFQPQGAHLPVAPAVPEYILRSIDYIRAHPTKAASSQ